MPASRTMSRLRPFVAVHVLVVLLAFAALARAAMDDGVGALHVAAAVLLGAGLLAWWAATRHEAAAPAIVVSAVVTSVGLYLALLRLPILVTLAAGSVDAFVATLGLFALRRRRATAVMLALATLWGACFLVEGAWQLRGLGAYRPAFTETTEGSLSAPDAQVFGRPRHGAVARAKSVTSDGRTLYDVEYHVGDDGTRIVPGRPQTGPEWRVFGDSFAFGMGLADAETIPARLQALCPQARVFNHGVIGHGTGDSLLVLRRTLRRHPHTAACVYLLIPDDFRRVALHDAFVATEWGASLPRFEIVDGRLLLRGRGGETLSPWRWLRVDLVRRSRFVRNRTPQRWATDRTRETVAALVHAMRRECDRRGARFLLANMPFVKETTELGDLSPWLAALREDGVEVVDLEPAFVEHLERTGQRRDDLMFMPDPHPRPEYAQLAAEWLAPHLAAPVRNDL